MFVYTLRSRDGQVKKVSTQEKLTDEEIEELDYRIFKDTSMTAGDVWRGAKASGQHMFYSMGEAAVDFLKKTTEPDRNAASYAVGLGPVPRSVIKELQPEYEEAYRQDDLENKAELQEISDSIREIRIKKIEETDSKTPLRVRESFPYKAVNAISQLGIQVAGTTLGSVTAGPAGFYASLAGLTIPVGYTIGKDDYYNAIGKTPSTATDEEQLTAENVGATNAVQSFALNTFGARGLQKVFLKNKSINKKFFKLAEEGKLTQDSLTSITKDVLKAAGLEGATEAGDQIGLNLLANTLFDYDPERETLKGSGEAFVLGSLAAGTFAGLSSTPRAVRPVSALPLKAINNVAKAVSGVSKSLAKGTLAGKDMVKNSPLTAKILEGLMKKGIDVSKIGEAISEKVVPITKKSVESLKNSKIFQKGMSAFDKIASPITSVVSSINKNVGIVLKSYSWDNNQRKADFLKAVAVFINSPKIKTLKANTEDFQLLLEGWHKSNNAEVLAPLIEKYDLSQEFQTYREALKSIREQAMAEGIDVGEIEGYLPRFVTNYEGLINSLGIKTDDNLMELFLKSWKKRDKEPSADEYANFLEGYILKQLKGSGKDKYKGIGTNPQKNRIIDNVSSDNVKFYADPIEATILYVNRLSTSITDQQFLRGSKELDLNDLKNIDESDENSSIIVRVVYDENPDRRLSPTVEPEGDVNTKRQGKVSQNGLPLIIGTPIVIKGVPVTFESNVDKALYIFHKFKKAKADPSLREYIKRQLDIKQNKHTGRNITAKGKEVVAVVNKANRKFRSSAQKGDDVWVVPDQEFPSGRTSINDKKLPQGHTKLLKAGVYKKGDVVVDVGGGKFNNAVDALGEVGATLHVYDPFNRTPEHNRKVAKIVRDGGADVAVSHNVLNVIKEEANVELVVKQLHNSLKDGGSAYITVYVDGKKNAGPTQKGKSFQRHQSLTQYKPIVERIFGKENVTSKGGMIIAVKKSDPKVSVDGEGAKVDPAILPKPLARGRLIQTLVKEIQEGRLDIQGAKKIIDTIRGALVKTGKYSEDAGMAFGQKDWADFSRGIKSLTTLAFLGSPLSTITQLGDFTYNLFENKAGAFQGDKDVQFDLSDVHMAGDAVGFEFNSDGTIPGPLQEAIDFMFTVTGFRKLDESLKVKYLNSTYNRVKTQLGIGPSKSSSKVFEEISDLMGPQRAQKVVDDIRSGKKSDAVAEFLFHKLSGIAPITKFDMSYAYLKYPNVRFMWALKSYTMKQLDYARRNVFKKIFSGDKDEMQEGLQNLFQMLIALMLANAPVEFLHAFLRHGDLPELSDLTTENFYRLLGLNSYTGMVASRDGAGTAAMGLVIPPLVSTADAVWKDATGLNVPILSSDSKSVRYLPIVGRHINDWQD